MFKKLHRFGLKLYKKPKFILLINFLFKYITGKFEYIWKLL